MVELVKRKALIGPVVAIIGSIMLIIAGLIAVINPGFLFSSLIVELVVPFVMSLILGTIGLLGAIVAVIGRKLGNYIVIIAGLVAVVGIFIPVNTPFFWVSIQLVLALVWIDPFLVLIGGILGIVVKEE